jgi:hypothetical protein
VDKFSTHYEYVDSQSELMRSQKVEAESRI